MVFSSSAGCHFSRAFCSILRKFNDDEYGTKQLIHFDHKLYDRLSSARTTG
jgi:hypothetical protein